MPKSLRFAIVLLLAAALAYVIYSSTHIERYRVEVCVAYQGQTACRTAQARTLEEATRSARDNACAQIVSGVTGTLGCQNTQPTHVRQIQ